MKDLRVSIAGFSVVDALFRGIDFHSAAYRRFLSKNASDGGLKTGRLTLAADLERFAGAPLPEILAAISGGRAPSGRNLGGPAIVGAVNAAQLLFDKNVSFRFFGVNGNDADALWLEETLARLPVDRSFCRKLDGAAPATYVFSDSTANGGKGERTFVSDVGVGGLPEAGELPPEFFDASVAWFGGTALVPPLHERLGDHLRTAKRKGMFTIVNTIFDFISEKRDPAAPWLLGSSPETYRYIDLLLVDWDEARRLSGAESLSEISSFFSRSGVSAFAITHGAKEFHLCSDGRLFEPLPLSSFRVSDMIVAELASHPERFGDTTGCGDNFAGGFASSFIRQLSDGIALGSFSLKDAASWAVASGGFACFSLGGTYFEKEPGEKFSAVKRYRDAWLAQ